MSTQRFDVEYRGRSIRIEVQRRRELVLFLNGIERKRRSRDGLACVYVWTNVELEWEEHHFIEARWWPDLGRVRISVNRATLKEVEGDSLLISPRTCGE